MTTVPFKASELLAYVNGWRPEAIDLSHSPLKPKQLWNYLSFLKVEDTVTNVSEEQLVEYMTTRDFVRSKGLTSLVKHALYFARNRVPYDEPCEWPLERLEAFVDANENMLFTHCLLLKSLPSLLSKARGGVTSLMTGEGAEVTLVGVNFVHVFEDPLFLYALVPDALVQDIAWTPYYKPHFEEYRYGGDNLIWFVNQNPDNIFFQAMA